MVACLGLEYNPNAINETVTMYDFHNRVRNTLSLVAVSLLAFACSQSDPPGTAVSKVKSAGKTSASKPKSTENTFYVLFETNKGAFTVLVNEDWAPLGARRFRHLVEEGYFNDCRFFRVISGFMVQFGINGDPAVSAQWRKRTIDDDPVRQSNIRGRITFATSGPHSRTTQLFINFGDNSFLDRDGFSPFGEVIDGMEVVDALYSDYGERPSQGKIHHEGNVYLDNQFPRLDYIHKATLIDKAP